MQRLALLVVLLLPLFGCSSEPKPATDQELAFEDQDPNGPRPELGPRAKASSPTPAPPADDGPIVTLIYVTIIRHGDRDRPSAMIFTSDPDSPYVQERPRPSRVLKPTTGANMLQVLDGLRDAGMDRLPVEEEALDAPIAGERQMILIRDGRRVAYRQRACKTDAELFRTFDRCERVLVRFSKGDASFVQTEGLAPIPKK